MREVRRVVRREVWLAPDERPRAVLADVATCGGIWRLGVYGARLGVEYGGPCKAFVSL